MAACFASSIERELRSHTSLLIRSSELSVGGHAINNRPLSDDAEVNSPDLSLLYSLKLDELSSTLKSPKLRPIYA
uniref:Uncharacterized protein n=1 Tax=Rhizophora mucronata TaxID=61149 RepID=A0A2P2QY72_RHIMU